MVSGYDFNFKRRIMNLFSTAYQQEGKQKNAGGKPTLFCFLFFFSSF